MVGGEYLSNGRLRRLPFDMIEPIEVYAARRKSDGSTSAAFAVVEAVQAKLLAA